jgi:malonyl CoA-acyl carrier protein transacylase
MSTSTPVLPSRRFAISAVEPDSVLLFPGQGSSLVDAEPLALKFCGELIEHCEDVLGESPFVSAPGQTRFLQPAIFIASIGGLRSLGEISPGAFAGHSLGELSALVAAGVLEQHDALELVILRGELMARAAAHDGDGGMLALLKGSPAQAEALAREFDVTVANDNAPGQVGLSGCSTNLRAVAKAARAMGLKALVLDVTGAFHTASMASACSPFRRALARVELRPASAPVFSGLTACPFADTREELVAALTHRVRWRETMLALRALGARSYVDVGPDQVLARLVGRNLTDSRVCSVEELHALHA